MIPLHLHISGFLSYRDPVDIDFSGLDLACIAGSNGAGKSSLLDAITWALFGQARKRDDSLINAQSPAAEVRLVFAYEGNAYRVLRSKAKEKTAVLEFHILQQDGAAHNPARSEFDPQELADGRWKPLTEHSLRETEARIQQTLRLDYDTFVNASFFLQGKADQFTQQRPNDRKRILSSILGLDIWEEYRRRASDKRRLVEMEIQRLDGSLQDILAELGEEGARTRRLQELQQRLEQLSRLRAGQETLLANIRQVDAALKEQQRMLETLGRQVQGAERRCGELRARLENRRGERQTYNELLGRADEIRRDHAAWKQAQLELAQMDKLAGSFRKQEKLREGPRMDILSERARLEQERQGLAQTQAQLQGAMPEIERLDVLFKRLESDRLFAEARLARREQLAPKLDELQKQQAALAAENNQLKIEMAPIKERIDKILSIEGAECPLCGSRLSLQERQRLADSLAAEGKVLADKARQNNDVLRDLIEQMRELQEQIGGLAQVELELRGLLQEESRAESRLQTLRSAQQAWEGGGALRLVLIERLLEQEDFAHAARARLAEIDAELRRTGYDPAAHDALRQQVELGQAVENELLALERAQSALFPLEREIGELAQQVESEETALAQQRGEYEQARQELEQKKAQAPDLFKAEDELRNLRQQENRLHGEVGYARQQVDVLQDLRTRRKTLESEREVFALQARQYKQLERAFGKDGVPALLIEQALPEIEAKANAILDRLTEGLMTVHFVTQAQYKDKKRDDLRETLDIQIRDGVGLRDYEMFSGGEAFRVNFAVRLALSEILARRAGARLQTLVIDEGFGSQDALGRQRLVEAIRLVRSDFAKILVITHIEELKDAFPYRIEVEKTARGSTARVV